MFSDSGQTVPYKERKADSVIMTSEQRKKKQVTPRAVTNSYQNRFKIMNPLLS
jgi:hypothetical protein